MLDLILTVLPLACALWALVSVLRQERWFRQVIAAKNTEIARLRQQIAFYERQTGVRLVATTGNGKTEEG